MSQALDDFNAYCKREGMVLDGVELLEAFADFLTFKGVKIGGLYRHFKGDYYIVKNVARDAEDWDKWRVEYVSLIDSTHQASRLLDDFLGIHKTGVRRFVLQNQITS